MPKKFSNKEKAEVHDELSGFDINIDSFGQLQSSFGVDKLNTFLNKLNTKDTKIQDHKVEEEE